MRATVANRLTGVNVPDLQDSCLQADNLAHRVGAARLRVDAIECGSGADQIKVVVTAEKDPRRRGKARRHSGDPAALRHEGLALLPVQRMVWKFGASEMAHHCLPADRPGPAEIIGNIVEFAFGQTEAGHSGVDMQDRRQRTSRRRDPLPFGNLARIIQHRNEPGFSELRARTRHQAVQYRDLDCRG